MSGSLVFLYAVTATVAAAAGTFVVRRFTLSRSIIDKPNERSSHQRPTPRGGGLAIVAVVLAALEVLFLSSHLTGREALALGMGGSLVAVVGWYDDVRGLSAMTRAMAHSIAALLAVACLGGMPDITVGASRVHLGFVGYIPAVLGVVWCINLYNFMDGIDGIAAVEAICVGAGGASLFLGSGHPGLAVVCVVVAAAALGFAPWNWTPAKIFMGDVGSGFLGYFFGVIVLIGQKEGALALAPSVLLLGVFIADASVTLCRRLLHGERWYLAHRTHAYQRAVRAGLSHTGVTCTVLALNIALIALAWVSTLLPWWTPLCLAVAVALLGTAYAVVEHKYPMYGEVHPPPEPRARPN